RRMTLIIGLVITLVTFAIIFKETAQNRKQNMSPENTTNQFAVTSSAFANNKPIPAEFTCKGQNHRPPLAITNAPAGTVSFAVILRDPDAVNGEWTHWLAWNLPGTTTTIGTALPTGSFEGTTSFGSIAYGGPCPPAGTGVHRYIFDLYALNASLDLPAG